MRQHFQARAAEADEAMRSYNELRARHERELAEFKAQEEARLKRLAEQDQAVLNYWEARLAEQMKDVGHVFVGATGPPDGDVYRIIVPTHTRTEHVDGQEMFLRAYGVKWKRGPFAHIFYELNKASAGIEELPFDRARDLLELARRREVERYKFFGLDIPTAEVLRWGLGGLVVIQLYLWLHLASFRRELGTVERSPEVAWIGLYHDWASRWVTRLSAAIIPLGASLYLTISGLSESGNWWSLVLGLAVLGGTAALSVRTFIELSSIWNAIDVLRNKMVNAAAAVKDRDRNQSAAEHVQSTDKSSDPLEI